MHLQLEIQRVACLMRWLLIEGGAVKEAVSLDWASCMGWLLLEGGCRCCMLLLRAFGFVLRLWDAARAAQPGVCYLCVPSPEHTVSVWGGTHWALPITPSEQNKLASGLTALHLLMFFSFQLPNVFLCKLLAFLTSPVGTQTWECLELP